MSKIILTFLLLFVAQHAISQEAKTNEEWISFFKRSAERGDLRAFVHISQSKGSNTLGTVSLLKIRKKYFIQSATGNKDILAVKPISDTLFRLLNNGFYHVRLVNREMQKSQHSIRSQKDMEDSRNPAVLYLNFAVKNKGIHNGHIRLLSEESIAALPNEKLKAAYNWLNLFAKAMYEKLAITSM